MVYRLSPARGTWRLLGTIFKGTINRMGGLFRISELACWGEAEEALEEEVEVRLPPHSAPHRPPRPEWLGPSKGASRPAASRLAEQ